MRKLIITALLTLSPAMVFADHAIVTINGKKITVEDTQSSLIKKLGKPTSGSKAYNNWMVNGLSIYASYSPYGLNEFSAIKLEKTPVTVNVDGKVIILGKDSIRSTSAKIKPGCFNIVESSKASTYSYITRAGVEGEYDVSFDTTSDDFNLKTKAAQPVDSVRISYEGFDANKGCTQ